MIQKLRKTWTTWEKAHPQLSTFIKFNLMSFCVTLFQMIALPVLKGIFENTSLVNTTFQWGKIGTDYYMFDYPAGSILSGGGGGLAYFLAVEITLFLAQVLNFTLQRNVTFQSDVPVLKAAFWYFMAYIGITVGAAALQGVYKDGLYAFMISSFGERGVTLGDMAVTWINCMISYVVFYPIMHIIFKKK